MAGLGILEVNSATDVGANRGVRPKRASAWNGWGGLGANNNGTEEAADALDGGRGVNADFMLPTGCFSLLRDDRNAV